MSDEDIPKDYSSLLLKYKDTKELLDEQALAYEDLINSLESKNHNLESKYLLKQKENETIIKEMAKLREANSDRNKDIDYLETKLEKEEEINNNLTEKVNKLEQKIVDLENENTNYFNNIRENDCLIDELRYKLDTALEDNIIIHSEYENFKNECDEKIQRMQEELQDNKNEVLSKEKMIQKLINHRDFLVTQSNKVNNDYKKSLLRLKSKGESINCSVLKNDNLTMTINDNKSINSSVKYTNDNKSILSKRTSDKFTTQLSSSILNIAKKEIENKSNHNYSRENTSIRDSINRQSLKVNNKNDFLNDINKNNNKTNKEIKDDNYLMDKINDEINNIVNSRKEFLLATLSYENFSFDYLNIDGIAKQNKIKTAIQVNEAIDNILIKLRDRKDKVLSQKRLMQAKFEKLGIKIN